MIDEFPHIPSLALGEYEHYKGKRYRVLGVGRHTEADEYFVVYTPLYEHAGQPDIWLRPYDMFMETVTVNGTSIPRFKHIDDEM
jgi:hypothetical protein